LSDFWQWHKSGWNSRDAEADPEGLVEECRVGSGEGIPLSTGIGLGRGLGPSPKKRNNFSLAMA